PSKNNRTNPSGGSPPANATATPHILPYIGRGTVKTTNPKHRPPTRNQPADKETPPLYKAEKPDATAEPSDACPAAPTHRGQSHHAYDHHPMPPQHAIEWRTECSNEHPKQKPCTKPTPCKCIPISPPKRKPLRNCTQVTRRPTASRSKNMHYTHTPARSSPVRKPTTKPTKGREPIEPKPKPTKKPRPVHPEINPASLPKPCRPL
ncbi:hypothetical protein ILYODFUR_028201, partial [Ilyodon furcidens]